MNQDPVGRQSVLIVSDVATEVTLVKSLLEDSFDSVLAAIDTDAIPGAFQDSKASVLVLAYRDLQRGAKFYQDQYRQSTELQTPLHPHRTIALCDRRDVRVAYDLCSTGRLDDYVQFWPTTYDAPRLLVSVRHALQACADHQHASQYSMALKAQSQRMEQLEVLLSHYLGTGAAHLATANLALAETETGVEAALAGLSKQILKGTTVQLRPGCAPKDFARELSRFSTESILPNVRGVSRTLEPLTEWATRMEAAVAPHIKDTRAQLEHTLLPGPTVLIVDDDQFQREMVGRIVESAGYSAAYAGNGAEALKMVRKARPDLILLDVLMPDMNGLEVVQRLKSEPAFEKIPIIMVTGESAGPSCFRA